MIWLIALLIVYRRSGLCQGISAPVYAGCVRMVGALFAGAGG